MTPAHLLRHPDGGPYVYATEGGETALAFSIATILMVLTLLINLTAGIIGRKLKRK